MQDEMRPLLTRLFLAVLLFGAIAGRGLAAESAAVTSARAVATLISDTDAVAPGQPYRAALRLRMAPGWHTYWRNPGDAGVAPELEFTLPKGVTAGPIAWPTPSRQPEDTLMTFGYSGEVLLPVTISGGPGPIELSASWLVCEKICVPEEGRFRLDLPAGRPGASAEAALFVANDARMPRPAPWSARISPDGVLSLAGEELAGAVDAFFMPEQPDVVAASAKQALTLGGGGITLELRPAAAFKPDAPLAGVLLLRDRGGIETAYSVAAVPGAAAAPAAGLLQVIGLAFLGGMILNLMPCVFPVLAMKAMGLARMTGQARGAARRSAAAYAAGVMTTFVAIAFILVALRHAGGAAGWGFQFQSPVFVAAMAGLLFAVGLNMSGVFQFGRTIGAGQSLAGREGLTGCFCSGALAVLVATPCTAPFMSVALTAGLTGTAFTTLTVFAALGAGLAAPYVLLATIPFCARLVPRPGRWMDVLKQALAFPMYGAVVWLVWVLSIESGPQGVLLVLVALTLVGFAAWASSLGPRVGRGLAVLAVVGAIAVVSGITMAEGGSTERAIASGAEPFSAPRLAELRAAGTPVFVNMTAAWCVSCLVNERVALARAPVRAALTAKGIVYLKGDWTRQDPAISAFLRSHGADGVPLYLFYPAGGGKPVQLPQILTPGIVLEAIGAS